MNPEYMNNKYCYCFDGEWCLKDRAITQRLKELSKMYADGEIIEVKNELIEIVEAIRTFEYQEKDL